MHETSSRPANVTTNLTCRSPGQASLEPSAHFAANVPVMPGNPLTDPNWATETTDTVVRLVDNVKAKTTKPAVLAARGLVFGLLAAFLGLFALLLLLIGMTRGLQGALDWQFEHARSVYISYFVVGGLLSLVGLLLFKKRNAESAS